MNREPLFACDGECECGHREEDLRVFEGKVLCDYCWEDRVWPEAPNFEQAFSDLPPFKSPHLTRNHPDDQWEPIETAPMDGECLLAIDTDDGFRFGVLPRDRNGDWIYEGEPTYCLSYYFEPTHWMPLPKPPKKGSEE